MSNIYEALQKGDTELSDVAMSMVADDAPEEAAEEPVVAHATNVESPPIEENAESLPVPAEDVDTRSSVAEAQFRRVSVRLSSMAPVFPFDGTDARATEQYRMIRTRIVKNARQPKLIAISSSSPGDGKTVTSVNIAAALSLNSSGPVLLVDGDFRRCGIATVLGLDSHPGLSEVLSEACGLNDAIVQLDQFPNLFVMVAGTALKNAAELLDSPRWTAICAAFRQQFEFIIIDTPPIAAVADYELIQAAADGVIFIARPDHSRRAGCLDAIKSIPKDKMLGVVLNCVEDWFLWRNQDYYYASYSQYAG
jgi:capsular exopolysaccharide synthesis family protein